MLNFRGIEYLLIGGYAVSCYGPPRTTDDLDIWVGTNPENAGRVAACLADFGFATDDATLVMLRRSQIIRMGVPPVRLELLTTISGVTFDECYSRRRRHELDGVDVALIALDDLKANKKASGRLKDLLDLTNLP